ncbi:Mov34/MPN/PAD-1 family protein [Pseudomonas koreensis]|nr:Mov34/MPN/PAD-1 family protein [Pseudomonas koreensis]
MLIKSDVLGGFYSNIQNKCFKKEAGGQLFSRNINANPIVIERSTGPYPSDQRGRHSWKPNKEQLIKDREALFKNGLYVVGLWHTHPQATPHPSTIDRSTCEAHASLLDSSYNGFLMITVGNSGSPPNLSVYFSDRKTKNWYSLTEKTL